MEEQTKDCQEQIHKQNRHEEDVCRFPVICILGWVAVAMWVAYSVCCWVIDGDLWFMAVLLLAGWAVIPIVLVGVVAFVMSWWQKHKMWKWLRLLGCLAIVAVALSRYAPCDRDIADYMAKNYQEHMQDLEDLIKYTDAACDSACRLRLEWEHGQLSETSGAYRTSWKEQDTTGNRLENESGITPEELEIIRQKVKQCRCIGIELDKRQQYSELPWSECFHAQVYFQRRGFAMYSYSIFPACPDTAILRSLDEDFQYMRYNDSVYFLYEGGAIGGQCWNTEYLREKEEKFESRM